jgi:hypothetical protein
VHADAPDDDENAPATQARHAPDPTAPDAVEYFPALHTWQVALMLSY